MKAIKSFERHPFRLESIKVKSTLLLIFLMISGFTLQGQVTIFSEDFELASGAENQAAPYLGWQTGQFTTTPPTNDNYWWVFDNTRCTVINGNYSMAVSQNSPATAGTLPQYRSNKVASTIVYYTSPIDASNYTGLTLDFNWICQGEVGFDYGTVLYSLDGNTWAALPGFYQGQSTVQNVVGLDLSVVDGQQFYLGFGWDNDNSIGNAPAFTIDDIFVKGTPLPVCSTPPNQPTNLSLSATGDSINGSFTGASPAPDNYLVVISTSATPPTPVNGTSYAIGDIIGSATVVDIDNNTSFTATGLSPSTTYYIYVFSFNSECVSGPLYNITGPLTANLTTSNTIYCNALTSSTESTRFINDVEFIGTLNDVSNLNNGYSTSPSGYQNWTGLSNAIQAQGEGINIYVGSNSGRGHYKAWVDWNKDGDFTDIGELVYDTNGVGTSTTTFGFTIPNNQTIGDYRIRIRFFNSNDNGFENFGYDFTSCETFDSFYDNNSTGNPNDDTWFYKYGETEDYLFTVIENCYAKINSVTDGTTCGEGTVDLQVTGTVGTTQFRWYDAETGGNLIATTSSGTWSPFISNTTTFWVTASNGTCESVKRTKIIGYVNPITTLSFVPETPTVCGLNDIIEISATGETELAYLIDEDFESGGLGVFTVNNIETNQNTITQWQNQTSTYVPTLQVWEPAISSGFGSNHFVMATSDVPTANITNTALVSPILDSSTFTDLTLNFDMYFSRYLYTTSIPENVNIEVSIDGGANWLIVQTYDDDIGYGTSFSNQSVDLSAYINQVNFRIRIRYFADYWCDGVAIDNIQLYGSRPLSPAFTWSGSPAVDAYTDAAATIPYIPGTAIGTVYIKPTLEQLELAQFTFTATATLSNGCDIVKDITIENNTKIWQGNNPFWTDPSNWKPNGVPDATNCVIIPNTLSDAQIDGSTDANAYNLTILNGGFLAVFPGGTITVQDLVDVNTGGSFVLESQNGAADGTTSSLSASLIQVNDVSNLGSITYKRAAYVRRQDYVYWSSPVENFPLTNFNTTTHRYKWNPTNFVSPTIQYGNWEQTTENMINGKGYAIRGPVGNGNTNSIPTWNTVIFSGVPNNGTITLPIYRGTYTTPGTIGNPDPNLGDITENDDNWNLVGNPYPSTLDADAFLSLNSGANKIEGTIWLWQHGIKIRPGNNPFFGDYVLNYDTADYLEYNLLGSTGGFSGYVGSGQGFFVLMDDTSSSGSTIEFNNIMRSSSFDSSAQFFRQANHIKQAKNNELERNRIWLDFVNFNNNSISTILLGYVEGATNDYDKLYDAPLISGSTKKVFMPNEDASEKYVIQGRSLPFNLEDSVPVSVIIDQPGNYALALQNYDGLFENQDIYLEDLELGTIQNLKQSPYLFMASDTETINNRFNIIYTNTTLDIDNTSKNDIYIIAPNNEYIKVTSGTNQIESVKVYDLLGRVLVDKQNINASQYTINNVSKASGAYIVKAILVNGIQKIQKVVLKF